MELASLLALSQCCKAYSCVANLPVSENDGSLDSPCCNPMEMPCFYQQASLLPKTNSCRLLQDMFLPKLRKDETALVTKLTLRFLSSLNEWWSFMFCFSPDTSFGGRYGISWHQALNFLLCIKMSAFLLVSSSFWLNHCWRLREVWP